MIILNSWVSGKSIKDTDDIFKSNYLGLFHLNIHWGGMERSPIKKSWGEEVKI